MDVQIVYFPAPGPASGGISIVGWAGNTGQTDAGRTVDLTSLDAIGSALGTGDGGTMAEDDMVLFFVSMGSSANRNSTMTTVGYTDIVTNFYVNANRDTEISTYYKFQTATLDTEAKVNYNGATVTGETVSALVLRGVNQSTPIDVTSTTAFLTTSTAADAPPITPVTSGALIVTACAGCDDSAFVLTKGANMTLVHNLANAGVNYPVASLMAYEEWTSGEFDPDACSTTGNINTGRTSGGVTMAFRPA